MSQSVTYSRNPANRAGWSLAGDEGSGVCFLLSWNNLQSLLLENGHLALGENIAKVKADQTGITITVGGKPC